MRFVSRILSRKAAVMLARNTVVSCSVFSVGFFLLWFLVEICHYDEMVGLTFSLLTANTLHYVFGRSWIYRGSERAWAHGYAYFLVNAGIGMAITFLLFAAFMHWTEVNYLVARVLVSLIAGLVTFLLNATLNFRQL